MTDPSGDRRARVDPRYDPAFQRGFAGGVERLRSDERAFARPGAAAVAPPATRAAARIDAGTRRPVAPTAPPPTRLPSVAQSSEAADAFATEGPASPLVEAEPQRPAAETVGKAPLLRNPWLLALLLAGVAGTAIGLVVLYTGYSSPPASYYGDSDTPSPGWIQRQILYYASIPLLGCLPFSILLALGVAAFRWRAQPRRRNGEEEPQTPDAPNSSPSR